MPRPDQFTLDRVDPRLSGISKVSIFPCCSTLDLERWYTSHWMSRCRLCPTTYQLVLKRVGGFEIKRRSLAHRRTLPANRRSLGPAELSTPLENCGNLKLSGRGWSSFKTVTSSLYFLSSLSAGVGPTLATILYLFL